jgi:GTPase SAR1 family protein
LFFHQIQWAPEITHYSPKTPFLLIGTQIDLRNDANTIDKLKKTNEKPITTKQGEKLAQSIKAVEYVECSAKSQVNTFVVSILFELLPFCLLHRQDGLKKVFDVAIMTTLKSKRKIRLQREKPNCQLL